MNRGGEQSAFVVDGKDGAAIRINKGRHFRGQRLGILHICFELA